VLSEITSREAHILHALSRNCDPEHAALMNIKLSDNTLEFVPRFLDFQKWFDEYLSKHEGINLFSDNDFNRAFQNLFTTPGVLIDYAIVIHTEEGAHYGTSGNIKLAPLLNIPEYGKGIEVLIFLSILTKYFVEASYGEWQIEISYLVLNEFGEEFLRRCDYELR
jgi:hypothetical protein